MYHEPRGVVDIALQALPRVGTEIDQISVM